MSKLITKLSENTPVVDKVKEMNKQGKGYKCVQYLAQKWGLKVSHDQVWEAVNYCEAYEDFAEFDKEFEGLM